MPRGWPRDIADFLYDLQRIVSKRNNVRCRQRSRRDDHGSRKRARQGDATNSLGWRIGGGFWGPLRAGELGLLGCLYHCGQGQRGSGFRRSERGFDGQEIINVTICTKSGTSNVFGNFKNDIMSSREASGLSVLQNTCDPVPGRAQLAWGSSGGGGGRGEAQMGSAAQVPSSTPGPSSRGCTMHQPDPVSPHPGFTPPARHLTSSLRHILVSRHLPGKELLRMLHSLRSGQSG